MAAKNIFQTLRDRIMKQDAMPEHERRAMYWFKTFQSRLLTWQKSVEGTTFNALQNQQFNKRVVSPNQALPGFLYFFLYQPKGAKTLPHYDEFPFVLVLDKQSESFSGLNFHYLDYYWRAWLFDVLYSLRTTSADPLRTRINVTYPLLRSAAKYKQFRPCYRTYLENNVRSPLLQVGEPEWDVALWMPVERFAKQGQDVIWKKSQEKFS